MLPPTRSYGQARMTVGKHQLTNTRIFAVNALKRPPFERTPCSYNFLDMSMNTTFDLRFLMNSCFMRYFAVGILATIVQFTFLLLLVELLFLSKFTAVLTSFFIGVTVNYSLQRRFTFTTTASHSSAALRFLGIAVLSAAANSILFGALNQYFPYLLAQLMATFVLFLANYQLNRKFSFQISS
jgi:putative flippase GtrA